MDLTFPAMVIVSIQMYTIAYSDLILWTLVSGHSPVDQLYHRPMWSEITITSPTSI